MPVIRLETTTRRQSIMRRKMRKSDCLVRRLEARRKNRGETRRPPREILHTVSAKTLKEIPQKFAFNFCLGLFCYLPFRTIAIIFFDSEKAPARGQRLRNLKPGSRLWNNAVRSPAVRLVSSAVPDGCRCGAGSHRHPH